MMAMSSTARIGRSEASVTMPNPSRVLPACRQTIHTADTGRHIVLVGNVFC